MANNFNEYKKPIEINECISRGTCSLTPNIAILQELAIIFLQQTSHYIILLEKQGAKNQSINNKIIETMGSLVSVNEYSDTQLFSIIQNEIYLLKNVKDTYYKLCKENNIRVNRLKKPVELNKDTTLAQAIEFGEKYINEKGKNYSRQEKNLIIILEMVLKSVCLNLTKLLDFEESENENISHVIETLDLFNHSKLNEKTLNEQITKLAEIDHNIQIKICKLMIDKFEGISETQVSHSTRKGKAILVSGNNFFDLLTLLEKTKDLNIDIYTHSNLLITHALKKFKNYDNLMGHFGDVTENCLIDFATFPGAILLTKNSKNNTEYFYRGRLFSTDDMVPDGVIKIKNQNFDELIVAAQTTRGFSKGRIKEDSIIGYNENEIDAKLNEITTKFINKEIQHLYIIGIDAHLELQKEYFLEFFRELEDNEFAISFSYSSNRENVLTIPIGNYIPLVTNILMKIFDKILIADERITFFLTTCDVMSISSLITLKNYNATNLYLAKCPPTFINPSVYKTLTQNYKIKTTSTPKKDLEIIRNRKSSQ